MTAPDLDPQLSASMRRVILQHAGEKPGRAQSSRRLATILGTVALISGVATATVVIVVAGLPGFTTPPPVASTPTTSATATPTPTPTPAPSSTPSPTPTATSEPTPTTPAIDPTDPSTWIIGFGGVGPVTLGASLEDQRQQLSGFGDITAPDCVGRYLDLAAPSGFSFLFVGGQEQPTQTAAITFGNGGSPLADDRGRTPKTPEGIGIDSTKDELLAAYPDIELTGMYQSDAYPYYGLTDGNGGWIVFGIINDEVSTIQIANEADVPIENRSVKTIPSERCPA
ncbi:hypothetical protein [Herbiconiux sp. UC225_62]|uniref:hypothetical protein n=1 Tax=Herbiconiux sp. UC225_62 TaxID=3350168 RepID=UPI0036D41820